MSNLLKDIAEKAGVTAGTVSRALSDKPGVSEKKRQEIHKLADEMNYVPNFQASSLRTGKRKGMTIITNQYGYNSIGTLRNYVLLQKAIEAFGSANIHINSSQMTLHQTFQAALAQNCRFLVINGMSENKLDGKTVKLLKSSSADIVFLDGSSENFDSVEIYRENGMYQAVRLLLMSDCKNILFYCGSTFENPNDRLRGIMAAYKSLNLPFSSIRLQAFREKASIGVDGFSVGYELTLEVLKTKAVDALFCSNDEMAIGALSAIRENGMSVPDDIKVVGFDNIPESKFAAPPLTTVSQPVQKAADGVIELCKRRMENKDADIYRLDFPTNLIVRESTPIPNFKLREEVFIKLNSSELCEIF